ncbi:MAG: hypothetical protein M1829_000904 [Trizodia sp. TS-e1964]|nr:MAG: hypothetical protein M1829_000904 [Trizodia sp. TS-e1964]
MPVDFLDFDPDGDVVLILNYCSVDWNNLASLEEEEEDDDDKDTDSEPHDDTEMEQKLHVRASSKHLKLASPVFRAMFRAEFREGAMVDSGASPNISLLDDDSIALLIILCVIHGHTKILPHQINLSLLAQIAVLADKYNLESYLSFFANLWIEQLKSNMPTSLTTKAFKWLTISWVFKRPSEFEIVTKIAVRESKWRLDNDPRMHLTIPKSIPGNFNKHWPLLSD